MRKLTLSLFKLFTSVPEYNGILLQRRVVKLKHALFFKAVVRVMNTREIVYI